MQTVFEELGAVVLTAGDGDAAVEMTLEHKPDLVILDAMLPKRSGFLVLEKLRSKGNGSQSVPVIMITGNQGKRHQTWAKSLGVSDYLNKPFRMERLIEAAERVLEG
ncbi:MAG: response regulator [bacterium]|nr:response regulator [bacterium]